MNAEDNSVICKIETEINSERERKKTFFTEIGITVWDF